MAVLLGSIGSTKTSIPSTLKKFVDSKNLYIAPIKFRGYGKSSKGYVIFNKKGVELVELEPIQRYSGNEWKIDLRGQSGIFYAKNLTQVVNILKNNLNDLNDSGYRFRNFEQYI